MASDDVLYAVAIVSSVAVGFIFRYVRGEEIRRFLSTGLGLLLISSLCGFHALHLVITVIGNCLVLSSSHLRQTKQFHLASFIWNFGYLAVFRTVYYVGIPAPSPITNAAQLFLTLRMTGLAFEVYDSLKLKENQQQELTGEGDQTQSEEQEKTQLLLKHTYVDPSIKEIVCYAFCYMGTLTGPYYRFQVYRDWLQQDSWDHIPLWNPLIEKTKHLPVIIATFFVTSYFFNIKYVETEEFEENPFWFRLFYMVPMFMIFRTRLYAAWLLSECMCITAALGAYPVQSVPRCGTGPTNFKMLEELQKQQEGVEYNFETIHNLDIYGCELAPTTKQGLRSWNMSVQYWLATYVHRRVPLYLKAFRISITMTVSAFWHGIHPGYYLSFLTVPPILMAEEAMTDAFRKDASPRQQEIFDWGCWFFKMRGFDYNCMGFLLLKFSSTLKYWRSIYFAGHVVTAFFYILGTVVKMLKPRRPKKE